MRKHLTVNRYCIGVILAAGVTVAVLAPSAKLGYITANPLTFGLLFGGLLLGELLPVKIPRRGGDEEVTLSTSFTFALLLLSGGLGPPFIAQTVASAVQDIAARKPWWRIVFNIAQYTLSMAGALMVIRLLYHTSAVGGGQHPFRGQDLPAILLGSGTFFAINTGLVGMAIALHKGAPIVRYFRNDALFVLITGNVLLFLAPIVVAATVYSPVLLPLFAAPILAIFSAGRQAVRSEHAAHHDSLTGLSNRLAFRETVTVAIEDGTRRACVLLMDLDRFKDVNDTLGHRYGDLLLQQVAQRLKDQFGQRDQIARLGGDEFAIFSEDRSKESAVELAQAVVDSLSTPFELDQIVVDAQASVGIALYPDDGEDVETLLQKADVAMYRAKETHAYVELYEERHDHHSPAKLALTADLRAAIDNDEIVVWYQPILDLESRQVRKVEALVRWEHPDLGLLLPGSFIDMAEHTNLIKPLTQRVIETSLAQITQWGEMGIEMAVAVNVSARVLVDREFASRVLAALDESGVSPTRLKLEVTESTLMADPETARSVLRDLDSMGVDIAIDDFGTGYSSLSYLADLPVSEVKIDRAFVSRMTSRPSDMIIVSSTIDLARHLGMRTVAEGVEDLTMLPELQALGCDAVQGYGVSRPLNSENLTRWLLTNVDGTGADRRLRSVA